MRLDLRHTARTIATRWRDLSEGGTNSVDVRNSMGVQIGDNGTQINYNYASPPTADAVMPPPLAIVAGKVDSPYRGLNAFTERDAPFFFGRETATQQVLDRISECADGTGMLVVSGASGAGKSSLLHAGVLPRLRGEGIAAVPGSKSWPYVPLTPGRTPLDTLAVEMARRIPGANAAAIRDGLEADPERFALTVRQAALGSPAETPAESPLPALGHAPQQKRVLILVDQLEQLFTQCASEDEHQAFIAALHSSAATGAALVLLVMRADFEVRCADYAYLTDAVQDRYLLTAMNDRELRAAISEPAKKAGYSVDGDLVDVLLHEVGRRPLTATAAIPAHREVSGAGVLPLLSHALDQAWRTRSGPVLTLADYERTGGIETAVASSAQRAYDSLTPAQQVLARQAFIRLTATSADGIDTAQRLDRSELTEGRSPAEAQGVVAVLEAFAAERLLTLDAESVEISHEVILTAWPLLRDTWLAQTHADRVVRTRLQSTAAEWAADRHDRSYLYQGSVLEAAVGAVGRIDNEPQRYGPLNNTERGFLRASLRAARWRTRRLQGTIAFLLALTIGLGLTTVLARHETQVADQQRDANTSQQLAAEATGLAVAEPNLAKQLAIAAYRIDKTPVAFSTLFGSQALPGTIAVGNATDAAFGGHGQFLALIAGQRVNLWSIPLHAVVATLPPSILASQVAFSPAGAGDLLAIGESTGMVQLWNVSNPRHPLPVATLGGGTGPVEQVAFSADGRLLGSAGWDHQVRLWDITSPGRATPVAVLTAGAGPASSLAFGRDDQLLATADWDGVVRIWNIGDPRNPVSLSTLADKGLIRSIAFDQSGQALATGGDPSLGDSATVHLWDVTSPAKPDLLAGLVTSAGDTPVTAVAFGANTGTLMAADSDSSQIFRWNVGVDPASPLPLPALNGGGVFLALSPDGQFAVAASTASNDVLLWDIRDVQYRTAWAEFPSGSSGGTVPGAAAIDPSGQLLALAAPGNALQLRDIGSGPATPVVNLSGPADSVAFAAQGSRSLLAAGEGGTVLLWDVAGPRLALTARLSLGQPSGSQVVTTEVALSPDGKLLATIQVVNDVDIGELRLWSVRNPREVTPLGGLSSVPVGTLSFGPGDQFMADSATPQPGEPQQAAVVLDIRNPQKPSPINGLSAAITDSAALALSPTSPVLATGDQTGIVRLWSMASPLHPVLQATISGTSAPQSTLAYSPDGQVLIGDDSQGVVHTWDSSNPATPTTVATTSGNSALGNSSLAATPVGGRFIVVTTSDSTDLFNIGIDPVTSRLCDGIGDEITATQWRLYIPGHGYQNPCPGGQPTPHDGTSASATPGPITPASLDLFAGSWYHHGAGISIDTGGTFTASARVYTWCGQGPPPCDRLVGNEIENGYHAAGHLSTAAGTVATGEVTQTTKGYLQDGPLVVKLNPRLDVITLNGIPYCGQYSPVAYCGA
jgi:WD40 repeat protein